MLKEVILSIILCAGCLFSDEASSNQYDYDGAGIIFCQAGEAREKSAWTEEGLADSAQKEAGAKTTVTATAVQDTNTLSDDDIIMVDDEEAPTDTAARDSVPPIEKMPELKSSLRLSIQKKFISRG